MSEKKIFIWLLEVLAIIKNYHVRVSCFEKKLVSLIDELIFSSRAT